MFIGEFIKKVKTTRETVRYYIDEKLLRPRKIEGKYFFTEQEMEDFNNIRELRNLGLSIRVIKQIQLNKKDCGTCNQWKANYEIIDEELQQINTKIAKLTEQKQILTKIKAELKMKLSDE